MAIGLITSPSSWALGTVITPTFLQNVTDNINGLMNGTGPTFKALQVDGIGGNASTQTSGTVGVSAQIAGNTPMTTFSQGTIYKDLVPFAYGKYSYTSGASPVFSNIYGVNISGITRVTTGIHKIAFATNATDGNNITVIANGLVLISNLWCVGFSLDNTGFEIYTQNSVGANTDLASGSAQISFIAFGH